MSVPLHRVSRRSTRCLALWSIATLFVIAIVVLLAACGSSSSSSSSTSPSASRSTAGGGHVDAGGSGGGHDGFVAQGDVAECHRQREQPAGRQRHPVPAMGELRRAPPASRPTGFDYDLSQAIGKKIGIPTSFNETKFDSIILAIQGGKNDMIMSDMYDNAQRRRGLDFVDYAYDGTSILVPRATRRASPTSTAWPARRSPAKRHHPAGLPGEPEHDVQERRQDGR